MSMIYAKTDRICTNVNNLLNKPAADVLSSCYFIIIFLTSCGLSSHSFQSTSATFVTLDEHLLKYQITNTLDA
jgi:hypothetical protein